ncbi:hypothetical protein V496_09466 [Pseudogymnoascus sp. VKM F-4515 (FW-2607)]|nr:hypothetical protein V496_09466 [Pseudogymnoascus sp. VKM F-4515 (FW-2607)]KFY83235.1 hypothetical protein V498_08214 [Pseudogymnoascus sp. VKM F-4517 (FW-2822)]
MLSKGGPGRRGRGSERAREGVFLLRFVNGRRTPSQRKVAGEERESVIHEPGTTTQKEEAVRNKVGDVQKSVSNHVGFDASAEAAMRKQSEESARERRSPATLAANPMPDSHARQSKESALERRSPATSAVPN